MIEIPDTLFSIKQQHDLSINEPIKLSQKKAIQKWKNDLDANILDIESENKDHLRDLMIDALGYPRDNIKAEKGEQRTRMDYSYTPPSGTGGVLFELKSRHKKLFEDQGYDTKGQETPVDQAITYITKNPNINYAVVTNFDEFILITRQDLRAQCYRFRFPPKKMELLDSEIRKFIHFFSKDSIENGFIEVAKDETILEEEKITNEFYTLFHQTRLMLIQSFQDKLGTQSKIEYDDAIKFAQMYLNRLIFLFFAQDNNLIKKRIFSDGIISKLNTGSIKEKTEDISSYIQTLFLWMDKGSNEIDNRHGFNGELFTEPMDRNAFFYDFQTEKFFEKSTKEVIIKKEIKLNKIYQDAIDRYEGKISPIIVNLLKLSSYDFEQQNLDAQIKQTKALKTNQISVNILGRIFEHSIGDLEKLQEKKEPTEKEKKKEKSKRKKLGVFYTPEYITTQICKNTIISYLSKNGATEPHDLIMEYKKNILELEDKVNTIKILDPACGSGAFLVKAVDVLIAIYEEIQIFKLKEQGKYTTAQRGKRAPSGKQLTIDKEFDEEKTREIIKDNIYGVDINPESVQITKLSLFLKTASKNRRLIGLDTRIMVGNSLIDDKKIEPERAFVWEDEFQDVLSKKWRDDTGFDIIVGNPPYIRVQYLDHKHIDWLKERYTKTAHQKTDISSLFFELGKRLLKKNGRLSFITSNQFLIASYGSKTRKFLLTDFKILNIIDFSWFPVFKDALTYVSIFNLENNTPVDFQCLRIKEEDFKKPPNFNQSFKMRLGDLSGKPWRLWDKQTLNLLDRLDKFPKISSIGNAGTGLFTGLDEVYRLTKNKYQELGLEKDALLPVLTGTDPDRYATMNPKEFVIYPYELKNGETKIIQEKEFGKRYPKTYNYLVKEKTQLLERKDSRKTFESKKDWFGLTRFGQLEIFKNPKIVTPGEVKENKFTIDDDSGFLNARVFCITIKDKKYDLDYVLGMMNTKIIQFYLHKTAPLKAGGYYGYATKFLDDTPIPLSDEITRNQVVKNVKKAKKLKKEMQQQINEFLELLKTNLQLEKTKSLSQFFKLDFEELVEELAKQKFKFESVQKTAEWRKFFIDSKIKTNKILDELKKIENSIEELAYSIYEVTSEEKSKILEG